MRISLTEQKICTGVANGLSNPEIAKATGLALSTIKNAIRVLFRKLGVRNRAQLVVLAMRAGIVK